MTIGFDAKRAFFNHSGLGNYSRFVISAMHENFPEHKYNLYTPKLGGGYIDKLPGELKSPQGVGKWIPSIWRVKHLGKRAAADRVDVFHGLSNEIPSDLKSPSVRKVVTIHDVIFKRYPQFYKKIDCKIYDLKTQYSCDLADDIVVVSTQTKNDLLNFYKVEESKIKVVGQDCHDQFHKSLTEEFINATLSKYLIGKPYLICVGTIESRKNQARIAQAFLQSHLKDDYELHFFGRKTAYQQELEEVIKGSDSVKVHNNAGFTDFPALYQGSSGLVYVSLFEGFGIPIVEAMHSKIPVITSKEGCFSEVSGSGALYVDPLSIEEIGVSMESVVGDDQLRTRLLSGHSEQLARFSASEVSRQLMQVYNG